MLDSQGFLCQLNLAHFVNKREVSLDEKNTRFFKKTKVYNPFEFLILKCSLVGFFKSKVAW